MKVLVTGTAGFIGFHVSRLLLERGDFVVGVDNLNPYYDPQLKRDRLSQLTHRPRFEFLEYDIADRKAVDEIFKKGGFEGVVHLAAQAGVRYSIDNPQAYVDSNLVGFANILEGCRRVRSKHLVFASSSSVYGLNERVPFSTSDNVDHPVSLYAATKKANELMAHAYSHLYQLPTTGLRLFTVYGPWGRPDMSPFLFAKAIMHGEPIPLYNHGKHRRDFTFVDDVAEAIVRCLDRPPTSNVHWNGETPDPSSSPAPWRIYNVGNNEPVDLFTYVNLLEEALARTTSRKLLPAQPGDVEQTYADVTSLSRDIGFQPRTSLQEGIKRFATWYKERYHHS